MSTSAGAGTTDDRAPIDSRRTRWAEAATQIATADVGSRPPLRRIGFVAGAEALDGRAARELVQPVLMAMDAAPERLDERAGLPVMVADREQDPLGRSPSAAIASDAPGRQHRVDQRPRRRHVEGVDGHADAVVLRVPRVHAWDDLFHGRHCPSAGCGRDPARALARRRRARGRRARGGGAARPRLGGPGHAPRRRRRPARAARPRATGARARARPRPRGLQPPLRRRPADAVVQPLDGHDVQAVLRWADRHDVRLAARSGGHSYAGYSTLDEGVVVDLRRLRGISVHRGASRASIGAGAHAIEVVDALARHGGAVPLGSCPTVGFGGLALGGGYGLAARAWGLTARRRGRHHRRHARRQAAPRRRPPPRRPVPGAARRGRRQLRHRHALRAARPPRAARRVLPRHAARRRRRDRRLAGVGAGRPTRGSRRCSSSAATAP